MIEDILNSVKKLKQLDASGCSNLYKVNLKKNSTLKKLDLSSCSFLDTV
jgi:hypothetical protein